MKRILIVLLIFSIVFSFTGCKGSDLKSYGDAVEKTDSISKGQLEFSMGLEFNFDTRDLTDEEIKQINYFKSIEGKMNIKFDNEKEKIISRNYFSFGGLGFDSNVYGNGDKIYLQMPIVGKYMDISKEYKEESTQNDDFISENSIDKIGEKWLDILQEDEVFSGKNTIMDTPDGEVKVTEYTIKIEDDKLKEFVLYVLDTVSKDENFKKNLQDKIKTSKEKEKITIDDIIESSKEMIKESDIENFNYTAYVDIDGYIVKEIIKVNMDSGDNDIINRITFNMNTDIWDIEKDQKFDFPDINEENILKENEIDQGIPFMFEDIDK